MDVERAVALVQDAAGSSSSPADSHSTTSANDAALALAWIQGQASSGSAVSARLVSRLAPALAALIVVGGGANAAVRANAAGAAAALAANADPDDGDGGALALDAAVSAPLAQVVSDAAVAVATAAEGDQGAAPPPPPTRNRALLINSLAALGALVPLGGGGGQNKAFRTSLASRDALLAVALGAGSDEGGDDLEVREAALDVLCAVAAAGGRGAAGGAGASNSAAAALIAAGAPAVAARVLILAGCAAEQEEQAAAKKPGAGGAAETPATELRMRCLLLLGMLCGGGGGGNEENEPATATINPRRDALRQVATEPGAIVGLLAAVRLGASDPAAANVARALLAGLRRDAELAPLVEEAVRGAVAAAAAAAEAGGRDET